MNPTGLEQACRERAVLVLVGAGGVGKTTVAAALALAAARRGRRVLVCTIDPARRLANALGLDAFGSEEVPIEAETLAAAGIALPPGGSLSAMMLDTKRTFDRLIERHAPDPQTRERILANPIYQRVSSQLAGSQEYMAMEKLYELHQSGRFDLVVLDTPPTRHALDFLQAPERLARFFDTSVVRWFAAPFRRDGSGRRGIAGRIAERVLAGLGGLFGGELLQALAEFLAALETLWGGFRERARHVRALLGQHRTAAFIVVSSPARHAIAEAYYFYRELRAHRMPVAGFVANRVRSGFGEQLPELERLAEQEQRRVLGAELAAALAPFGIERRLAEDAVTALGVFRALASADRRNLAPLRAEAEAERLAYRELRARATDIHSLAGLAALEPELVGPAAPPPRASARPVEAGQRRGGG
ncbi:MAG: anion transporter [Planctomycetota bacterium]|nr:MAG: anion transporter [Planctomycetota bacterium]